MENNESVWLLELAESVRKDRKTVVELANRLVSSQKKVMSVKKRVDTLIEDAVYTRSVLKANGALTMTAMAKELGLKSAIALSNELQDVGIIYKQGNEWLLKSDFSGYGLAAMITNIKGGKTKHQLAWTERGRKWLHSLKDRGYIITAPKPKQKKGKKPVIIISDDLSKEAKKIHKCVDDLILLMSDDTMMKTDQVELVKERNDKLYLLLRNLEIGFISKI